MKAKPKLCLSVGAAALSALLLTNAYAGNIAATTAPNANVQVFSVEMNLGDYLAYTGSLANAAVVIDDLTYSVELDPCCALEECAMFRAQDLLQGAFDHVNAGMGFGPPDPHGDYWGSSGPPAGYGNYTQRYAFGRGTSFRACMYNGPAGMIGGGAFDMVSHQIYGETVGRERGLGWFAIGSPAEIGPDTELLPVGCVSTSIGVAVAMVNTSESRHYQTPEVFYTGANPPSTSNNLIQFVSDWDRLNGGNFCPYNSAKVCVKGRIIAQASAPSKSYNDFTITHP